MTYIAEEPPRLEGGPIEEALRPATAPPHPLARWLPVLLWTLVVVGVLTRVRLFIFNRALLMDEIMLALNLIQRPFSGLFEQLDHNQGAPIGFLLYNKVALIVLGNSEFTFRLLPLFAGIASVFVFYAMGRRLLAPLGLVFALTLFAFGEHLVEYSTQLKQYSTDVLFTLAIVLAALEGQAKPLSARRIVLYALGGAAVVWFSHAAVVVLAAVGAAMGAFALLGADWSRLGRLTAVGGAWGVSVGASYFVSLRGLANNDYLLSYWNRFFMPLPPTTKPEFRWFIEKPFDALAHPVGLTFTGLAALFLVCGAVALWRTNRQALCILAAPILLTLLMSGLRLYPFGQRMILFLAPLMIVLIAAGLDLLAASVRGRGAFVAWAAAGLLLLHPVFLGVGRFVAPSPIEEIREVLQYLGAHKAPEDAVYVYYWGKYPLEYYGEAYGLEKRYVTGRPSREDWRKYIEDVEPFRGRDRVWFLFSNIYPGDGVNDMRFFLTHLDDVGTRLDGYRRREAGVYLYDLRPSP